MARTPIYIPSHKITRSANLVEQAYVQPVVCNYSNTGLTGTEILVFFPVLPRSFILLHNTSTTNNRNVHFVVRRKHDGFRAIGEMNNVQAPVPTDQKYTVLVPATKRYILGSFPTNFASAGQNLGCFYVNDGSESDIKVQVFHLAEKGLPRYGMIQTVSANTYTDATHQDLSISEISPEPIDIDANLLSVTAGNFGKVEYGDNVILYAEHSAGTAKISFKPNDDLDYEPGWPNTYDLNAAGRFIGLNPFYVNDKDAEFQISGTTSEPKFLPLSFAR